MTAEGISFGAGNQNDPFRHDNKDESLRLDKWLWQARFFKTRAGAAKLCAAAVIRTGGQKVTKPAHKVRQGDVLAFPLGAQVRVIRVLALGCRRGPAAEARSLYEDLAPPPAPPLNED